jgi:hypothetical protein
LETYITNQLQRSKILEVVADLGMTISCQPMCAKQCIYLRNVGRRKVFQGTKWKIFEEILSKHMGRRLVKAEPKTTD